MRATVPIAVAVAAAAVVGACGSGTTGPAWYGDTPYRKVIALAPPGTSELRDFPVGIVIDADAELAAGAVADGSDLVFTDADGISILADEVERFQPATGALVAWVRVPALAGPTTLYLYYGGATVAHDPAATWSPLYGAVWHLAGEAALETDSTTNGHDLIQDTDSQVPGTAAGASGAGRMFDGVDDALYYDDPGTGSLDPAGSFSYCAWVRPSVLLTEFDCPFWKGGSSGGYPGYDLELGQDGWTANISDDTMIAQSYLADISDYLIGRLTHVCGVVDRSAATLTAFTNGAPRDAIGLGSVGSVAAADRLTVGNLHGAYPYAGVIDEVRVYTDLVPLAWIEAEHANLADAAAFVTVGPEETR